MKPMRVANHRLNSGGYDAHGAYFGHGQALWALKHEGVEIDFCRAEDKQDAIEIFKARQKRGEYFNEAASAKIW